MRIIALLFFSCKETKRQIKDLFQVYTFWSHWHFLPHFKGMLCYSWLCSKKNLQLLISGLSLSRQILWPLGTYYFCLWKSLVEPLYGYLRTSISSCVFYQIGGFQAKSSELPCMVMLPFSSAQPKRQQKGENKQSKTLNKKHMFWQVSLPLFRDLHCQTWLKLQCDHHVNL